MKSDLMFPKKKRRSCPSVKTILNEAWELQSKVIRVREKGICRTCGTKKQPLSAGVHAGHLIHTGKGFSMLDFNYVLRKMGLPPNIFCQCFACNHFKSGERDIMFRKLIADGFTVEQYDGMRALKIKVWKPSVDEATEIRDYYRRECISLGIDS